MGFEELPRGLRSGAKAVGASELSSSVVRAWSGAPSCYEQVLLMY